VRDAEVEDQAPAASGVPQVVADLNVAAPLSRAGGDAELRAAEGSVLVRALFFKLLLEARADIALAPGFELEPVLAELLRAGGGCPSSVPVGALRSRTPPRAKSGAAAADRCAGQSDCPRYDGPHCPWARCALRRSSARPFLGELWARVQHARSSAAGRWGACPRTGKNHVARAPHCGCRMYKYKHYLGNRCFARLRLALQMCCVSPASCYDTVIAQYAPVVS
jgi:hypothetical protein